jgi:DNA-binding FrmR family transcriptional regulator
LDREETKKNILNRLKTIKGHIGGVEKMIEEDKTCEEILLQVGAVKASIHKVGVVIMEDYARECIATNEKMTEEEIVKLEKVIQTLLDFSKR